MKKYELLKDLPEISAGTLFELSHDDIYTAHTDSKGLFDIDEKAIKRNHSWFKEVQKEWEIVSFYDGCKNGHMDKRCLTKNERHEDKVIKFGFTIHSVRRLSDGEVFSIGDRFSDACGEYSEHEIIKFHIDGERMNVIYNEEGRYFDLCLSVGGEIKKLSTPTTPATFEWTDELVKDILQCGVGNVKDFVMQPQKFIDQYKASKQANTTRPRIGNDNICPVTKLNCDDETCVPGAECNLASGYKMSEVRPLIKFRTKKIRDNWYCYSTIHGYDHSFCSDNEYHAVELAKRIMDKNGWLNECEFPETLSSTEPKQPNTTKEGDTEDEYDGIGSEELKHMIRFWKESNYENYEKWKKANSELVSIKGLSKSPSGYEASSQPQNSKARIAVKRFSVHGHVYSSKDIGWYEVETSLPIPKDKFPAIKQAIEEVLNGERRVTAEVMSDTLDITCNWPFTEVKVNGEKYGRLLKLKRDVVVLDLKEMRENKEGGSTYYAWQANIAMAFFDEYFDHAARAYHAHSMEFIHEIANKAAKRFLDLLIRPNDAEGKI